MLMAVPDLLFLVTREGACLNYYAGDPAKLFVPPDEFLGKHDEESLWLQVADFGRGFEPEEAERRGLGLVSMRERVDALSGEFTVQASTGRGTRIGVRLPLSYATR
jgi:histidine kinase/DNA gyrase B/HSP90-like ATPase